MNSPSMEITISGSLWGLLLIECSLEEQILPIFEIDLNTMETKSCLQELSSFKKVGADCFGVNICFKKINAAKIG